jgi:ribosomal protein S18 acetylase RimI-like enzyme
MPTFHVEALDSTHLGEILPLLPDLAQAIGDLYGPVAGDAYARQARDLWRLNLSHPLTRVVGVRSAHRLAGIGLGVVRGTSAEIPFLHVCDAQQPDRVAAALVESLVPALRQAGAARIIGECVPLSDFSATRAYQRLGFLHVPRSLMGADLSEIAASPPGGTQALVPARHAAAAECMARAYAADPGRVLHAEMRSPEGALGFIERVACGAFGRPLPEACRCLVGEGGVMGVVLGAYAADGVAFVLQVTVDPAQRRRGQGAPQLRDLAAAFEARGDADRVLLGVTKDNPAARLYARLGFRPLRDVEAYVWEHPLNPGAQDVV